MLKKRSDTDIVTSLLIQWGNKLMNHLQKKLVTQKHVGENCQSVESCWVGTAAPAVGESVLCIQWQTVSTPVFIYILFGCYAQAQNKC